MNTPEFAAVPPQPAGSTIVLERNADGVTLKVPPLGLRRGGGFLFWWTLLWNAMVLPFAVVFYCAALSGAALFDGKPAGFLGFLLPLPFLFFGGVSLLIVLHLGRRRAALAVVGDRLLALRVGLFHTERGEWARDKLSDVRVGPCGVAADDKPLLELQILPKNGSKFTLLAGRGEAELKWMAAILKEALSLRPEAPAVAEAAANESRTSAAARGSRAWIGATIGGTFLAGFFWLLINNIWTVNGVGLLDRLGLPWFNLYTAIVVGALIGGCIGAFLERRRLRHARQLAAVAASMEFAYRPDAPREALRDFLTLRLFKKWSSASNRLTGRVGSLPVEMLDYISVERDSDGNSYVSQTVLLAPADPTLPAFELRPGHLGMKLLSLFNIEGVAFAPDAAEDERDGIERFGRLYHLSEGLDVLLETAGKAAAAGADAVKSAEPRAGETAIRQLFTPGLLRFFADHPGWSVESDGKHLALWRRQTVIPAADRPAFLAEALEVHQALTHAEFRPGSQAVVAAAPRGDPFVMSARVVATVLGLFLGFFAGFVIAVAWGDPIGRPNLFVALFVGGVFLGPVFGALMGNRVLYYPIYLLMRRRRAARAK